MRVSSSAGILAAAGDADPAERLYRSVSSGRSGRGRTELGRASSSMLAGSPGAAALHALAELADARGDAEAGAELRAHAGLASA